MNNHTPKDEFLVRWMKGELAEDELAQWQKQPEYKEYKQIMDATTQWEVPAKRSTSDAWHQLSMQMEAFPNKTEAKRISMRPIYSISAVAAVIVLLIGMYFFFSNTESLTQTSFGETASLSLPDGSAVMLNASSQLIYQPSRWDNKRTVELNGEAFFEVMKGSTFTVATEAGGVEVLGTSFNVKARDEWFEVVCYTGKVRVTAKESGQAQTITPGEALYLGEDGKFKKVAQGIAGGKPEWPEGKFVFKEAPFEQVLNELENQYDIKVEYNSPTPRVFSGAFFSGDLEAALSDICNAMSLEATIESKELVRLRDKK